MSRFGNLTDGAWWRDVVARGGRQVVQVVTPVLVLAAAGDVAGVDPAAVALTAALAFAVTVLNALAGWTASPLDPWGVQAVQRCVIAAAGALLAVVPANALDLLAMDWGDVWTSVLGSVGLALAAMITNTPGVPTRSVVQVGERQLGEPARVADTTVGTSDPSSLPNPDDPAGSTYQPEELPRRSPGGSGHGGPSNFA